MGSFPLKNALFSYPRPFNPKFQNVSIGINDLNFACPSTRHIANYLRKKFFPKPYPLATIYPLQTDDRQTDGRTTMPNCQ